jgi:hypothetical protein
MAASARFEGRIRHWREEPPGRLAVVDIPPDHVAALGGRRQWRVRGTINGVPFTASTMLAAGGGFCVGASRAAMVAAGVGVGDNVTVEISRSE